MLSYPHIDPVIIQIGPLAIRWYGMMYLLGFVSGRFLVVYRIKKTGKISVTIDQIDTLFVYLILGLVLGARLGYVVFYDLSAYIRNPIEIFSVWHGGMSFHGGLIGSIIAGMIFTRKYKKDFWELSDLVIVAAPIGLGLGRLGNFINGELYGRVTAMPWGMVFPGGGPLPRHPSQIYELLLEGVVLFVMLWSLSSKGLRPGKVTASFIVFYGLFRIIAEFFREPDPQIGFILGIFTMGQLLSALMMVIGAVIYLYRARTETVQRTYKKS
jgi:phosphatidylglycerol:prolipoprotein diacylglycerol transferase